MMQLTIIGFGNQAKAWAQNLKDSGFSVRVALKALSPSIDSARQSGFEVVETHSEEFFNGSFFALLIPDHLHEAFFMDSGRDFSPGSVILYAHGFSVTKYKFQERFPGLQHVLFAPKSIGSELRHQYLIKGKLGAVFSLEHFKGDSGSFRQWLFSMAEALGINMGPYQTTFLNETQADLYSEQGLLCSLVPYAAGEIFQNLIDKGIEPELAYFECWHELKLIVNAMVEIGPLAFFDLISPNALVGSDKGYKKIFTQEFKSNLKGLLTEIQDGTFSNELDSTDILKTREIIKERWRKSALTETFDNMQRTKK